MRQLFAVVLAGFFVLGPAWQVRADDQEVTDESLLEDLGAGLLKSTKDKPTTPLDERLLEQLDEDVDGRQDAKEDDWLSTVVRPMRTAKALLERRDETGSASSAQAEAISGLDAMIAELSERKSQCSGGQCDKPGTPKPGKQKPGSSGKAGQSPAQAASGTTSDGADLSTELAVAGALVKDLWGQLPQRQREQILQPLSEEFLPKYASEIEAYFRSLANPARSRPESP